jgi:hypothetical protein
MGGGQITGTRRSADRPHSHSRIFFRSCQHFWRTLLERDSKPNPALPKNNWSVRGLCSCRRCWPGTLTRNREQSGHLFSFVSKPALARPASVPHAQRSTGVLNRRDADRIASCPPEGFVNLIGNIAPGPPDVVKILLGEPAEFAPHRVSVVPQIEEFAHLAKRPSERAKSMMAYYHQN